MGKKIKYQNEDGESSGDSEYSYFVKTGYYEKMDQWIEEARTTHKIDWCQEAPKKSQLKRLCREATDLTTLKMYDCIRLHKRLHYFKPLINLKILHLDFGRLMDSDLKDLQPLVNVEELSLIQNNKLTGSGFRYLTNWTNLLRLNLQRTGINDRGIKALCRAFPQLEELTVWTNCGCSEHNESGVTNYGIAKIGKRLKQLKSLELGELNKVTDLKPLKYLTKLTKLYAYCKGVKLFPVLPRLEILHLSQHLSSVVLPNPRLNKFKALVELDVVGQPPVTLRYLPKLQQLAIGRALVNDDLVNISPLVDLRRLDLRCNGELDDDLFAYLVPLLHLEELNLNYTKVTPEHVAKFQAHHPNNELIIHFQAGRNSSSVEDSSDQSEYADQFDSSESDGGDSD